MVHPWPVFAPEVNYTSMMSGAGPAPMLAYGDVLLAHGASLMAQIDTGEVDLTGEGGLLPGSNAVPRWAS